MAGVESLILPALITAGTAYASHALAPKPPKPSAPTRMPDPQSPEVMEERRRRVATRQAASGRESTILSDDTFASNTLLGE
jgi:hypothetical protein